MSPIYKAIADLIGNTESAGLMLALVISVGANGFLGYFHIVWRREERQDRKAVEATITGVRVAIEESNKAVGETMQDVRNAISAMTGRPI